MPLAADRGAVEGAAGHMAGPRLPVLGSPQGAMRQPLTSSQEMTLPGVRNPSVGEGD